MTSFGEKLRKHRLSKGLSINWVGEATGIGRSNFSSLENGRRSPSNALLEKLVCLPELGLDYRTLRLWKLLDEYPEFASMVKNLDDY